MKAIKFSEVIRAIGMPTEIAVEGAYFVAKHSKVSDSLKSLKFKIKILYWVI